MHPSLQNTIQFSNWAYQNNFEPTFLGEDDSRYPSIPDDELSRISSKFLGEEVERFILQYLHLPEPILSHIKGTERGDTFRIMFDSLVRWRNMRECQGENTAAILGDLMLQFAQKCLQETGIPCISMVKKCVRWEQKDGLYRI